MKPMLRTIKDTGRLMPSVPSMEGIDPTKGGGYALPPEMANRPDAAELRAFMQNFQKIGNPDDRRMVMEAVHTAAASEPS